MDIGKKLRDARNAAGLTQESAAESLGVSVKAYRIGRRARPIPI